MRRGTRRTIAPLLAALGLAAGCAQGGPFSRPPLMVGTLKTEVARIEQEKETYRRRVAELESENRRMADELAQERAFSTDLEARLADARALLDRRGLAAEPAFDPSPPSPPAANWDSMPSMRTQPAADAPRSRRKAPFAQIGGSVAPAPDPAVPEEDLDRRPEPPAPSPRRDPFGPQSRTDMPIRWLPVADSTAAAPATR